jgi:DNA polymerase V
MTNQPIPFYGYVQAGFASPAGDYAEEDIDLAKLLAYKPSVFYLRARNDSMIEAGIHEGAILVIDKALSPKNYDIVIASLMGDFTVKYYVKDMQGIRLLPANPKYKPLVITEEMGFQVWGVVKAVVIETRKL